MSTSNRLARAVDRARELSKQLEEAGGLATPEAERRLRELAVTEQRTLQLLAALRSIYLALGSFAFAAVGALVHGSILLVRETRLVVQVLHERAQRIRALAASDGARKG